MNGFIFWKDVLNRVSDVATGTSIIAGGCIRDYMLGLVPKDIDVFVNSSAGMITRDPEGFERLDAPEDQHEAYAGMNNILRVSDWEYQETAINIIEIATGPYTYVNGFDNELCKGLFDGGALEVRRSMGEGLENKEVLITKMSRNSADRAVRFVRKIHDAGERGWRVTIEENDHNRRFQQPGRDPWGDFAQFAAVVNPVAEMVLEPGGVNWVLNRAVPQPMMIADELPN